MGKNIVMATHYILLNQPTPKEPARPRPAKPDMARALKISWSFKNVILPFLDITIFLETSPSGFQTKGQVANY